MKAVLLVFVFLSVFAAAKLNKLNVVHAKIEQLDAANAVTAAYLTSSAEAEAKALARDEFYRNAAINGMFVDLPTVQPTHNLFHPSVRYRNERISSYVPIVNLVDLSSNVEKPTFSTASSYSCDVEISGPIEPAGIVKMSAFANIKTEVKTTGDDVEVTYSAELGGKVTVGVSYASLSLAISGTFESTCTFNSKIGLGNQPMAATMMCIGAGIKQLVTTEKKSIANLKWVQAQEEKLDEFFEKTAKAGKQTKAQLQSVAAEMITVNMYGVANKVCNEGHAAFADKPSGAFSAIFEKTKLTTPLDAKAKTALWDEYVNIFENFFRYFFFDQALDSNVGKEFDCNELGKTIKGYMVALCMYYKAGMDLPDAEDGGFKFIGERTGSYKNFRSMVVQTFDVMIPAAPSADEDAIVFRARLSERIHNFGRNWVCVKSVTGLAKVEFVREMKAKLGRWKIEETIVKLITPKDYSAIMKELSAKLVSTVVLTKASFTGKIALSFSSEISEDYKFNVDVSPGNKKCEYTIKTPTFNCEENVWKYTAGFTIPLLDFVLESESSSANPLRWETFSVEVKFPLPDTFAETFLTDKLSPLGDGVSVPWAGVSALVLDQICKLSSKDAFTRANLKSIGSQLVSISVDGAPTILSAYIDYLKVLFSSTKSDAQWIKDILIKLSAIGADAAAKAALTAVADALKVVKVAVKTGKSFGFSIEFKRKKGDKGECGRALHISKFAITREKTAEFKIGVGAGELSVEGASGVTGSMENADF